MWERACGREGSLLCGDKSFPHQDEWVGVFSLWEQNRRIQRGGILDTDTPKMGRGRSDLPQLARWLICVFWEWGHSKCITGSLGTHFVAKSGREPRDPPGLAPGLGLRPPHLVRYCFQKKVIHSEVAAKTTGPTKV